MTYAQANTIKRKAPFGVYVRITKRGRKFGVYMTSITKRGREFGVYMKSVWSNFSTTDYKRALRWLK